MSSICLAQTIAYPAAGKRLLGDAGANNAIADGNQGMAFFGSSVMGLVALDMSLTALRILGANDRFARSQLEESRWAELDELWARARALRNEFVYFDQRIADGKAPSLVVDGFGIHAEDGPAVSFQEWGEWISVVERVGRGVLAHRLVDRSEPVLEPAQSPTMVSIPPIPPGKREGDRPRLGSMWFASTHVENSHTLIGRSSSFGPVDAVSMTAHFGTTAPRPVELRLRPPDGEERRLQRWIPEVGHQLVTFRITGIADPGPYDVSIVDEGDPEAVRALGRFRIGIVPAES